MRKSVQTSLEIWLGDKEGAVYVSRKVNLNGKKRKT
jgi:hypothetical protein